MPECLRLMREIQDHYFREAKREGYLSRAAYKLIEIDDRKKILRPGDRVLDCGAAPGSWLQVAAQRVGPKGVVVGIDVQPIGKQRLNQPNVRSMQGDFTATPPEDLLRVASEPSGPTSQTGPGTARLAALKLFDVILSDMAPDTTGDPGGDHHRSVRLCEALLDRCPALLRTGGKLVMKVFEGEAYPELLKRVQSMFESARGFKPKASRGESREMYVVASGHRAAQERVKQAAVQADEAPVAPPSSRPPPAGWTAASC